MKTTLLFTLTLLLGGCSSSNNLLLGRVQATVGGHEVVVTDCYRTSVPPPETNASGGAAGYHWAPCKDADVIIRGDQLVVNGVSYGTVRPADAVLVDHGKVSVEHRQAS